MKTARVEGTESIGLRQYRNSFLVAALFCATLPPGTVALAQYAGQPQDYQGQGDQAYQNQDNANPSGRVGRLAYLRGNVSIEPDGVNNWSQADTNYPVATGDRLYTDPSARAEVSVGSMVARMSGDTDMTMTNLSDQIVQIGLAQGTLRIRVYDVIPGNQIEVDTPNGAITLNQPGDVRIDVPANNGVTEVAVNQGTVEISGPNLSQDINQGNAVELTGSNPVYLSGVGFPRSDDFDQWSVSRDRHILDARSAQYVSRDMPGFDDLDDYGNWQPDTEYGPVWYPNNVDADYVPYQNGHWIWVDPYGWTWVDAAPWGYAPFHYGRWALVGSRWGWIPGPLRVRPYWAPALVAFVGGGDGFGFGGGIGYAAWFPLGVGEPYVPSYHCGPSYIRNINVTNINITVIHNTTIVNNYNTFVHSTNNYSNVRNIQITYQNRERGFTAVNARAFSAGQPVRMNVARGVTPQMIRSSTIIAHPAIVPTRQSIVPRPVQQVPVSVARPVLLTRGGKEQQAAPGSHAVAVPYKPLPVNQQRGLAVSGVRTAAPIATAPIQGRSFTPNQPAPVQRQNAPAPVAAPAPVRNPVPVQAPTQPRTLINRSETPVKQPTFQQQQPALRIDPGRPLGPQQRDNVSRGVPAGRSPDVEAFPHQQPVRPVAAAPRPVPQPVRPATPAPSAPRNENRPAPLGRPQQHR